MARQDTPPMVKPQLHQQKRGNSSGNDKEAKDKKNGATRTTPNSVRRSNRQTANANKNSDSYLSSDPNFAAFKKRLEAIGLELRDIIGDGNCLFRALGDQLNGSDCEHFKHREEVVRYMIKHEHDFAPFVEDDVPFAKHIEELGQPGTFAGNDAIVAFARLHKVNIIIHQLDAPAIEIKGTDDPGVRQLHISYHNGDHYSSVRGCNDSTNKPGNIRLTPKAAGDKARSVAVVPAAAANRAGLNGSPARPGEFSDLTKINEVIERTGCDDLELVKSSLADNDNDVAATIDTVMAVLTFARSDSASSSMGSDGEQSESAASMAAKAAPKGRSHQLRSKKAEKKLRRMQERREQYLVAKASEAPSRSPAQRTNNPSQSDVVVINSSKLNIVSV